MPWWNPYGWWAYIGWYPITAIGLVLVALWYLLDWVAPPGTRRRHFVDRFMPVG